MATVVAPTASESNTKDRYVGRFCLSRHLGRRFSKTRDGFGMMGVTSEEQEVEDAKRQDTYLLLYDECEMYLGRDSAGWHIYRCGVYIIAGFIEIPDHY